MSTWCPREMGKEKENLEKQERAQCSRSGFGGPMRREHLEQERKDDSAKVDRKEVHSATVVDKSGTSRGIVQREQNEEEKEIRRVAKRGRATTAESRDI